LLLQQQQQHQQQQQQEQLRFVTWCPQIVAIANAIEIAIGLLVVVAVVAVACCTNYAASSVIDVLSRFLEKTVLFARRSLWFVL